MIESILVYPTVVSGFLLLGILFIGYLRRRKGKEDTKCDVVLRYVFFGCFMGFLLLWNAFRNLNL